MSSGLSNNTVLIIAMTYHYFLTIPKEKFISD